MDGNIFDDCPRYGNGEPKWPDQLKRWQENRCVYCGTPRAAAVDMLGPACTTDECQAKRWAESNLTEGQECVFQGNWEGKEEKEIADEMKLSPKSKRVKELKKAIAKKLWVRCDRVFLARCYGERRYYFERSKVDSPLKGSPLKRTPQK